MTEVTKAEVAKAGCPVTGPGTGFSPFTDSYVRDPYPIYESARERAPVFYAPQVDHWVVSRYETIRAVLMDPHTYLTSNISRPVCPWPAEAVQTLASSNIPDRPTLSNMDADRHGAIRRFLRFAFTPKRLAWVKPHTQRFVTEHIDSFIADGQCDLVPSMLHIVPVQVLSVFLGLPLDSVPQIRAWADVRENLTWGQVDDQEILAQVGTYADYFRFCVERVDELEQNPGEDYISELLRQWRTEPPEGVERADIVMLLVTMLMAGHKTTADLATNGLMALLRNRDQWEAICDDPSLIPGAVEEMLRYETSVPGWRRLTAREVELEGQQIPAGSQLMLLLGSANRDERRFDEPSRLDVTRRNASQHLTFGAGAHYCLGAPLARQELATILEELTSRIPSMRLAQVERYDYPKNLVHRGPFSLPVVWKT
jgi:cytochrome P450